MRLCLGLVLALLCALPAAARDSKTVAMSLPHILSGSEWQLAVELLDPSQVQTDSTSASIRLSTLSQLNFGENGQDELVVTGICATDDPDTSNFELEIVIRSVGEGTISVRAVSTSDDNDDDGAETDAAEAVEAYESIKFAFGSRTNGANLAQGTWNGTQRFSALFLNWNSFVFLLETPDGSMNVLAKRSGAETQKSFVEKYGSWIMLGGFFVLSQFLKHKAKQWAQPPTAAEYTPSPAARAAAQGATAAQGVAKQGAAKQGASAAGARKKGD
eukprot:TRINITY_DN3796_c0_g1_i2.p2 TRINITY_DN3796_c0_g1~~TRINITY_DN3796_c0_g1_i2.p2  ORF type:complete len:282 (-),score=74.01 TRINITY_DN3796_c0_g1_i2:8-826(-)